MAFSYKNSKGKTYFLHHKSDTGRGSHGSLFFFSKDKKDALDDVPKGYDVIENERNGVPILKRAE